MSKLSREELFRLYEARESGLSWRLVGEEFGLGRHAAKREYLEFVAQVVRESGSLEEARKKLEDEGR